MTGDDPNAIIVAAEAAEPTAPKGEAIAAARTIFPTCQFDESACDLELKRLSHYRKEWDDELKDRPRHDDSSHSADAFITFACSGYEPPRRYTPIERDLSWALRRLWKELRG